MIRRVTMQFFGKFVNTGKMKTKIPILPLLWIFAVCLWSVVSRAEWPTEVVAEQSFQPMPRQVLEAAVRTLESRRSISAKIFQEVDLFDKRLIGSGVYLEQRAGYPSGDHCPLMRLELRIQLGDKTSSLVQVCDGQYLWTYQKLLGRGVLHRLDVARAMQGLRQIGEMPRQDKAGALPGLGGLPKLLRGLHAAFDFYNAQRGMLKLQDDSLPVWQLRGRWKPEMLVKVLPKQKKAIEAGKPADLSKLPEHLPDHVLLMLGHDDLFPYRIEYRRSVAEDDDRQSSRTLVTMQLFEVVIDVQIDPNKFHYNPGDLEFEDETEKFLESLKIK